MDQRICKMKLKDVDVNYSRQLSQSDDVKAFCYVRKVARFLYQYCDQGIEFEIVSDQNITFRKFTTSFWLSSCVNYNERSKKTHRRQKSFFYLLTGPMSTWIV